MTKANICYGPYRWNAGSLLILYCPSLLYRPYVMRLVQCFFLESFVSFVLSHSPQISLIYWYLKWSGGQRFANVTLFTLVWKKSHWNVSRLVYHISSWLFNSRGRVVARSISSLAHAQARLSTCASCVFPVGLGVYLRVAESAWPQATDNSKHHSHLCIRSHRGRRKRHQCGFFGWTEFCQQADDCQNL